MGNQQFSLNAMSDPTPGPLTVQPTAETTFEPTYMPITQGPTYQPTQGPTQSSSIKTSVNACYSDEDCMNPDSYSSTPDKLVYSCPTAKCKNSSCECGSTCKQDPYSGMCCQDVQNIRGDSFCIENTSIPGLGMLKYNMKQQIKQQMMKNKKQ